MGGGGGDTGDGHEGSAFAGAPLAAAVVEALPRVRGLLEHGSVREQMRAASLLTALLCAAPPAAQLRALAARRVLRAALLAFFADDRNGGGRQVTSLSSEYYHEALMWPLPYMAGGVALERVLP